jgi:hypothetical protein
MRQIEDCLMDIENAGKAGEVAKRQMLGLDRFFSADPWLVERC